MRSFLSVLSLFTFFLLVVRCTSISIASKTSQVSLLASIHDHLYTVQIHPRTLNAYYLHWYPPQYFSVPSNNVKNTFSAATDNNVYVTFSKLNSEGKLLFQTILRNETKSEVQPATMDFLLLDNQDKFAYGSTAAAQDCSLYKLNCEDGSVVWNINFPTRSCDGSPTLISSPSGASTDAYLLLSTKSKELHNWSDLYLISTKDGKLLMQFEDLLKPYAAPDVTDVVDWLHYDQHSESLLVSMKPTSLLPWQDPRASAFLVSFSVHHGEEEEGEGAVTLKYQWSQNQTNYFSLPAATATLSKAIMRRVETSPVDPDFFISIIDVQDNDLNNYEWIVKFSKHTGAIKSSHPGSVVHFATHSSIKDTVNFVVDSQERIWTPSSRVRAPGGYVVAIYSLQGDVLAFQNASFELVTEREFNSRWLQAKSIAIKESGSFTKVALSFQFQNLANVTFGDLVVLADQLPVKLETPYLYSDIQFNAVAYMELQTQRTDGTLLVVAVSILSAIAALLLVTGATVALVFIVKKKRDTPKQPIAYEVL